METSGDLQRILKRLE